MPETDFLPLCLAEFRKLQQSIERAVSQIAPQDFHRRLDAGSNNIAELLKHLAGNTRSRCLNILSSDGEKPGRDRDSEFVSTTADTPETLRQSLEEAWAILFEEYSRLTESDLGKTILIRGEPHSVRQAILRQLAHHAGHTGQIVMLAKHFAGARWLTLSIPRGQSKEYEKTMRARFNSSE